LFLLLKDGGLSVDDIAKQLQCNFKTISEHIRRLAQAGLVNKRYQGRQVRHNLSPYGLRIIKFLETF